MKKERKQTIKKYGLSLLVMLLGSALMGLAVSLLLLPNLLSSGGFSGLATIPYYLFNIPAGTTILILNIPCFILAFIRLGKKFFVRSLVGTGLLSFFINFFEKFPALTEDRVLACIYGGILIGIGTALILKVNGSTRTEVIW